MLKQAKTVFLLGLPAIALWACGDEGAPITDEFCDSCDDGFQGKTGASIDGVVREAGSQRGLAAVDVIVTCDPDNERDDRVWVDAADQYGRYRIQRLPSVRWCYMQVSGFAETDSENHRLSNAMEVNSGEGSKSIELIVTVDEGSTDSWTLTRGTGL